MARRIVTPFARAVSPTVSGRVLAAPWRRGLALASDLALLAAPTLALAFGVSLAILRARDPGGFKALISVVTGAPEEPAARRAVMVELAELLVRLDAPGLPPRVPVALEDGDLDTAARLVDEQNIMVVLQLGRPARLEPGQVLLDPQVLIPRPVRGAAVFLVPALYFTLFTRGRRGATPGKRLLGIRVVRLDGEPLGLLVSLERFGSYFAVAGTVGIGLLDLWREPNRRLSHDRVAGTVVVRSGRRRR